MNLFCAFGSLRSGIGSCKLFAGDNAAVTVNRPRVQVCSGLFTFKQASKQAMPLFLWVSLSLCPFLSYSLFFLILFFFLFLFPRTDTHSYIRPEVLTINQRYINYTHFQSANTYNNRTLINTHSLSTQASFPHPFIAITHITCFHARIHALTTKSARGRCR